MTITDHHAMDTIFALSSASGKAGVSVIRVSGPKAWESLAVLTKDQTQPQPRAAKVMALMNPQDRQTENAIIDLALVIGFKAPASFTGEDVIEYHCHGSLAIVEEMLAVLSQRGGHRLAQHGEFTRRAFENGKLDLTEAEAIADLIDAETKAQKEQALHQMGGSLSSLYNGWAEDLTRALAYVEAIIDFPDEDVPDTETAKALPAIEKLQHEMSEHLNDNRRGERLRSGLQVVIIGAPNAGKSSLVNALAQRDVAIVSEMAGTTRDVIEVHLNLGGYPVILADTAGLRPDQIGESGHEGIESEGIKRALKRASEADLKILMFDGTAEKPDEHTLHLVDENSIILVNKIDMNPDVKNLFHVKQNTQPIFISTKTGEGVSEFLTVLTDKISKQMSVSRETPSLTRQRHRTHLEECHVFLKTALEQSQPELMAQDLRFAVNALGRITGRVDVEDLLDVIFKDFCIGK
ncbi:MAG: tRNA uridine-5-carboxymethylaminomethyl(34) synthesis GTPase MnmE [Alphaproteobacteria bacterium]